MELDYLNGESQRTPWNKNKIIGQKAPLKLKEIWAIRFRLQENGRLRCQSALKIDPLSACNIDPPLDQGTRAVERRAGAGTMKGMAP